MSDPILTHPVADPVDPYRREPIAPLLGLPRVLVHLPGQARPEVDGRRSGAVRVEFVVMGTRHEEVVTSGDLDGQPAYDEKCLREVIAHELDEWFNVRTNADSLVITAVPRG